MPSFTSILVLALSAVALVAASPTKRNNGHHTCTPNFEGASVSIISGWREWVAESHHDGAKIIESSTDQAVQPDFRIEQTGHAHPSFIIK